MQWRAAAQRDHKPVVIMLTDSGDNYKSNSLQTFQAIMAQEAQLADEERLTLHMIGFGPAVDLQFVEQLANMGNGSHLVCQTGGDVDRLDLVKAFGQLAAQPALKVSLLHTLRGTAPAAAGGNASRCAAKEVFVLCAASRRCRSHQLLCMHQHLIKRCGDRAKCSSTHCSMQGQGE